MAEAAEHVLGNRPKTTGIVPPRSDYETCHLAAHCQMRISTVLRAGTIRAAGTVKPPAKELCRVGSTPLKSSFAQAEQV